MTFDVQIDVDEETVSYEVIADNIGDAFEVAEGMADNEYPDAYISPNSITTI